MACELCCCLLPQCEALHIMPLGISDRNNINGHFKDFKVSTISIKCNEKLAQ